jgi:hypothetical protein
VFIVEARTRTGKLSESYATYEEARRRVDGLHDEIVVGMALIFQELPDGSQRLVRDDGKPLQWHRLPDDDLGSGESVPLSDEPLGLIGPDGQPTSAIRFISKADESPP